MKILFFTPGLGVGGAERFLSDLAIELLRQNQQIYVYSLGLSSDRNAQKLAEHKVNVICLERSLFRLPHFLLQIYRETRKQDQVILQGWMYLGDLMALVASKILRIPGLFWSVRNTNIPNDGMSLSARLSISLSRSFSRVLRPEVIACAETALQSHLDSGFRYSKSSIVGNSVPEWLDELEPWEPRTQNNGFVIGMAGRMAEGKGHLTFLKLLSSLQDSTVTPILGKLVGNGVDTSIQLESEAKLRGLTECLTLQPQTDNIQNWLSGIHAYIMCSEGWEGFPNALLEAASFGVPAIAVDLGASKEILLTSQICKRFQLDTLSSRVQLLIENYSAEVERARSHKEYLRDKYSVENITAKYLTIWRGKV